MVNKVSTLFTFDSDGGLKKIKADIAGVDGAWNKAKTGFKSAATEFRNSNLAQGALLGGLAVGAKKAIDASSDLTESVNAVSVTYGEAGDAVLALGENSAQSFGLSTRAFNEFSTQFSAFAGQIAESGDRDVSQVVAEMTTRVADFASVHNLSMEEAAQVAQSTLAGETESFRRYGGDVSAATIKTYAYANGIAEAGSELTEGQKVLARYGAFMEQTSELAGDFANTSDSLANSQRILAAESENAQAKLGEGLAPALAKATEGMVRLVEAADKLKILDAISLEWVEGVGTTLGKVLSPWNKGAREANEAIVDAFNDAERAAGEFDHTLLEGVDTFEEARAIALDYANGVEGLEDAQTTANLIAVKWNETTIESAEAQRKAEEAALQNTESMRDQAKAANNTADVMGELRRKQEEVEAATERAEQASDDYAASLEAQKRAVDDLNNANIALIGGDVALRQAKRDAAASVEEFTETAKEAEAGTVEYDESMDNAILSLAGLADEATNYRIKQMEANGETASAADKAKIMREELGNVLAVLAPGSPLAAAIQAYIDQLNNIPRNVSTVISVKGGGSISLPGAGGGRTGPSSGRYGVGAEGAIVNRPTMALIGEAGPEALVPLDKLPGNQSVDGLASSMGGGRAGVVIGELHLHTNANNADQFARDVRKALEREMRWNGPSSGWSGR